MMKLEELIEANKKNTDDIKNIFEIINKMSESLVSKKDFKLEPEKPKVDLNYVSKVDIATTYKGALGLNIDKLCQIIRDVGHPFKKSGSKFFLYRIIGLDSVIEKIWSEMEVNSKNAKPTNCRWIFRHVPTKEVIHCKKDARNEYAEKVVASSTLAGHLKLFADENGSSLPPELDPPNSEEQ